jgi:hypothetical protein
MDRAPRGLDQRIIEAALTVPPPRDDRTRPAAR